jgi:hypothetical protein
MAAPMIPEFFPRDRYYCVLDDQPDFLVPSSAMAPYASLNSDDPLQVNPRAWMGWHGPLPASHLPPGGVPAELYDEPWIIWVDDPDRGAVWPYWLGRDYAHLLQHLQPGDWFDGGLSPDVVMVLRVAGVLVTPTQAEQRRQAWAQAVTVAADQIGAGYVSLQQLLPPYHIGALRRYYRYHTRSGTFTLGDDQTGGRYVAYDEPLTRFVHQQLTSTVCDLARRVVVPSYNYLAFYQGGAVLDPHTDREACEYTLSVCIDATPDPLTHGAWPINVMSGQGPVSFTLGIGDGLLFRGRTLSHWRDRLPDGYTSSSVLFHFVDAV